MRAHGATRIVAKKLAPNDNSKNQIYLGGDFSALNIIPHGEIYTDGNDVAGSKRDRAKARVRFWWIGDGFKAEAPDANLILYPKYPEVRLSGFLRGSQGAPNDIMTSREPGRVLILGTTPDGEVLGFAAGPSHAIAREVAAGRWEDLGVFEDLPVGPGASMSAKQTLLAALKNIYRRAWIASQKLSADGTKRPYAARNGGGYTLEAELGITPNGYSEPDYLGWEVKQYGVKDFTGFLPKGPVTLMTPEPTGGLYQQKGVTAFVRKYGYADKSGAADRLNIGGIYVAGGAPHHDTGLRAVLEGFDAHSGKITDFAGGICLIDRADNYAARWPFKSMLQHWNRKHSQAAYIPSIFQTPPPEYAFGPRILLCEQTDFTLFLKAFASGVVYYDPAIKLEYASTSQPATKRRSQFRVKHSNITQMYYRHEVVDLRL